MCQKFYQTSRQELIIEFSAKSPRPFCISNFSHHSWPNKQLIKTKEERSILTQGFWGFRSWLLGSIQLEKSMKKHGAGGVWKLFYFICGQEAKCKRKGPGGKIAPRLLPHNLLLPFNSCLFKISEASKQCRHLGTKYSQLNSLGGILYLNPSTFASFGSRKLCNWFFYPRPYPFYLLPGYAGLSDKLSLSYHTAIIGVCCSRTFLPYLCSLQR